MGPAVYTIFWVFVGASVCLIIFVLVWLFQLFGLFSAGLAKRLKRFAALSIVVIVVALSVLPFVQPYFMSDQYITKLVFDETSLSSAEVVQADARGGTDFAQAFIHLQFSSSDERTEFLSIMQPDADKTDAGNVLDNAPRWLRAHECASQEPFLLQNTNDWDLIAVWICADAKELLAAASSIL